MIYWFIWHRSLPLFSSSLTLNSIIVCQLKYLFILLIWNSIHSIFFTYFKIQVYMYIYSQVMNNISCMCSKTIWWFEFSSFYYILIPDSASLFLCIYWLCLGIKLSHIADRKVWDYEFKCIMFIVLFFLNLFNPWWFTLSILHTRAWKRDSKNRYFI